MNEANVGYDRWKPGQDCQAVATARILGQSVAKIHGDPWGVVGTLGDSVCYIGVAEKVDAIQAAMGKRIGEHDLPVRLLAPNHSGGISDGQRNGTPQMRYSLIGRETTNDGFSLHFEGSDIKGVIAVVACDKPPVGTTAAVLERNVPAVIASDGSTRPGVDPQTGETIDLVSCFHIAGDPDAAKRERWTLHACPGQGSCGGMFTYNTMQSFIATLGLQPLHMVSPASDDPRRIAEFPEQLVDCLETMTRRDLVPRALAPRARARECTAVRDVQHGRHRCVGRGGRARVYDGERHLLHALVETPQVFRDGDMVVIRYEGPRGAPGMPEMLDPTSRITTLCRERGITIALMTDARFSGGSVGLVIGHVGPEAALGGPIALVEDGDTITVDLKRDTLDCDALADETVRARRVERWESEARANGGVHPSVPPVQTRLLRRMRALASTALDGGGIATPAVRLP